MSAAERDLAAALARAAAGDFAPTAEEVRDAWVFLRAKRHSDGASFGKFWEDRARAEFDRWLSTVAPAPESFEDELDAHIAESMRDPEYAAAVARPLAELGDPTPAPETVDMVPAEDAWIDRHGDVWRFGGDGLMHTPETAPFPREHVEKKWGPLRPVRKVQA